MHTVSVKNHQVKLRRLEREDEAHDDDFLEKNDDLFERNRIEFHKMMEEEMKLEDELEQKKIMDKIKSNIRIGARVRRELNQNKQKLNKTMMEEKHFVETIIEKKRKCLCFIANHKAIVWIAYFDMITCFLGITIPKTVGACLIRTNY